MLTLLECINDPNLFGPFFRRKSWAAWRVFLAALFAERGTADDLALYRVARDGPYGRCRPCRVPIFGASLQTFSAWRPSLFGKKPTTAVTSRRDVAFGSAPRRR